ncbi:MAG: hypothetical protein MUF48_24430 [Pirellulaceae bacterium]|nr:hypothetical protein [Pirellulaceae bacterium]
MHSTNTLSFVRTAAACVLLALCGCQESLPPDRVPVVPVEGALTFDGKPVPGALVVFHPTDAALLDKVPPPRATVREDGTFKLTTYTADDGAPVGAYQVTVEWRKLVDKDGDVKAGPNVLPERYTRPKTSGLVARVVEGANRLPQFVVKR